MSEMSTEPVAGASATRGTGDGVRSRRGPDGGSRFAIGSFAAAPGRRTPCSIGRALSSARRPLGSARHKPQKPPHTAQKYLVEPRNDRRRDRPARAPLLRSRPPRRRREARPPSGGLERARGRGPREHRKRALQNPGSGLQPLPGEQNHLRLRNRHRRGPSSPRANAPAARRGPTSSRTRPYPRQTNPRAAHPVATQPSRGN
jgi:hypothetical protein